MVPEMVTGLLSIHVRARIGPFILQTVSPLFIVLIVFLSKRTAGNSFHPCLTVPQARVFLE